MFTGASFISNTVTQPIVTEATAVNLGLPATSTEQMIHYYAYVNGVSEAQMTGTLRCESQMNPHAIGDHGHSFGLAQIYLPAHPTISKADALDPEFAIRFMASQFAIHRERLWTCWRNLYL